MKPRFLSASSNVSVYRACKIEDVLTCFNKPVISIIIRRLFHSLIRDSATVKLRQRAPIFPLSLRASPASLSYMALEPEDRLERTSSEWPRWHPKMPRDQKALRAVHEPSFVAGRRTMENACDRELNFDCLHGLFT